MTPWPEPRQIRCALPPVEKFDEYLLPDPLRRFAVDVSQRMQVPLDLPAVAGTVTLAGVVNRRAEIQPKAKDSTWREVGNLWGGIISPPGTMKSPVINITTAPVHEIERCWRERSRDLKKHDSTGDSPRSGTLLGKRLLVNDSTPEKLQEIMSRNPDGLLVIRDELAGWIEGLQRKGREGERAFYLTAANGNTPYVVDRIERGTIVVEGCCLSFLGGVQPDRLMSYVMGTGSVRLQEDGLLQRFQLLIWPDQDHHFEYVDRLPDEESIRVVHSCFERLTELSSESPALFRFHPDAQPLFVEWYERLERRIRVSESDLLTSHIGKYRGLMPKLALVFELCEMAARGFVGSVGFLVAPTHWITRPNTERAIKWCDYLESHARRIYSLAGSGANNALFLLAKINQSQLGKEEEITVRELEQKGWAVFKKKGALLEALSVLEGASWIRDATKSSGKQGGRPSPRYEVNPCLWDAGELF